MPEIPKPTPRRIKIFSTIQVSNCLQCRDFLQHFAKRGPWFVPDPCCSCKVAFVPLNLLPIVRYLDVVFSTSKRQKCRFVVYVLTAQGEQVSETLGKDRVFSVSRRAEDVDSTSPWETDVLPHHQSHENTLRLDKQQCSRLFPTQQLNLFNRIVLHSIAPLWNRIM